MTLLAIMSDTHDQLANLRAAVDYCNEAEVKVLAHCGDLISPFMLKQLDKFKGQVHLIYGNNVGDQHLISGKCRTDYAQISHHGMLGDFTVGKHRIGMIHYPKQARALATQNIYDIVCCGHSHEYSAEIINKTLFVNPGHMLGENNETGFYIVDLDKLSIQRIGVGICMFDQNIPIKANTPLQL